MKKLFRSLRWQTHLSKAVVAGIVFFQLLAITVIAQSTDANNPTPLASKPLRGNIAAHDGTEYFYSFSGGPGKVTIKLSLQRQSEFALLQVEALDQNRRVLLTLEASSSDGGMTRALELNSQQRILLRLKSSRSSVSSSFVLSLDGPVAFNAASPSPPPSSPKDTRPPQITITSPNVTRGQSLRIKSCNVTIKGRAIDESGIQKVGINGVAADVDREGRFSADLSLNRGDNRILVTATNTAGKTATEEFKLACENALPPVIAANPPSPDLSTVSSSSALTTAKQYALVIGINDYQHLNKLNTAVIDAQEVAEVLRDQYGFEVKLLINSNREQILIALNEYQQKLNDQTRLLIYYAGHGTFDKDGEKAYWMPVNADPNSDLNWIMADEVTVKLKRIPARHVLIISDSCYSGALSRATVTKLTTPAERERYLLKANHGKSRILIASGGIEPVSDSGGGKHSVFAAAFLRGLREIDDKIFTAEELFRDYILQPVAGKSEQKPEYNQIRNSGHDGGDFVFIRRQ